MYKKKELEPLKTSDALWFIPRSSCFIPASLIEALAGSMWKTLKDVGARTHRRPISPSGRCSNQSRFMYIFCSLHLHLIPLRRKEAARIDPRSTLQVSCLWLMSWFARRGHWGKKQLSNIYSVPAALGTRQDTPRTIPTLSQAWHLTHPQKQGGHGDRKAVKARHMDPLLALRLFRHQTSN